MKSDLYPKSPTNLPTDFLKLPSSYRNQVIVVMIAILLFILLYIAMIAASAWLIYLAFIFPLTVVNSWTIIAKIGAIGASIMLFAFTLKFIFKKMSYQHPTNTELKEKDQPTLFAFIRQLCTETGAPFPKKIIVNEEINAAVFYDNPLLSMFLPVKKNLLIGLGLVNSLNLTEFKAVLAHEFGHFSQRSMKLGSYVYMANRIIHDMVYNRDKWDEMLDNWGRSDFRVAIFAWILKGAVWVIRNILKFVYKGINLVHASLSRQMEFNADLVAVSVTGSNAIINGLSKIMRSSTAMNMTYGHLATAAEHQLYTNNLFYHQFQAEQRLKEQHDDFKDREPVLDSQGIPFLFNESDKEIPSMYASHPPNFDREKNAKKVFVDGVEDTQSAWVLFENVEQLKELVTKKVYDNSKLKPKQAALQPAEEVNNFIQSEIEETTYDAKYHGTYEERYLHILNTNEAQKACIEKYPDQASALTALQTLYNEDLAAAMTKRQDLQKQCFELQKIAQTIGKQKTFEFNGQTHQTADLGTVYNEIDKKIGDQYQTWFKDFDHQSQLIFFALLTQFDLPEKEEYWQRIHFHQALQTTLQDLLGIQDYFNEGMSELQQYDELDEHLVNTFENKLNHVRDQFVRILGDVENLPVPKFRFIEEEPMLSQFLLSEKISRGGRNILSNRWISRIAEQLSTATSRASRLYHKSLGNLVALQEQIAEKVTN